MGIVARSLLDRDRDDGSAVHPRAPMSRSGGLWRFPLVMLLVAGLLLSLLQCATCGGDFAPQAPVSVAINLDQETAPDVPDQQLPCHGGHCLSHVVQQAVIVAGLPADVASSSIGIHASPPLVALAGLPLFKPPRV